MAKQKIGTSETVRRNVSLLRGRSGSGANAALAGGFVKPGASTFSKIFKGKNKK